MAQYTISSNELYHFGIPGMRWGVRRFQNEDGSLTPAGQKKALREERKNIARELEKEHGDLTPYRSQNKDIYKRAASIIQKNKSALVKDVLFDSKEHVVKRDQAVSAAASILSVVGTVGVALWLEKIAG